LGRFDRYGRYLHYPGDWGERAFRIWLVYELFHDELGWPVSQIVCGEAFDVLFVDDRLRPVLYLETKRPHRDLADEADFLRRIPSFQTIKCAVLTDGYEWLCYDVTTKERRRVGVSSKLVEWEQFLLPLQASWHLYEVKV